MLVAGRSPILSVAGLVTLPFRSFFSSVAAIEPVTSSIIATSILRSE
jgi:hypothetical protein